MTRGVDGCGPGWTARYMWQGPRGEWGGQKPDGTFDEDAPCIVHDLLYTERRGTRYAADRLFLEGMLARSETWRQRVLAHLYYRAVRTFGGLFWRSGLNR